MAFFVLLVLLGLMGGFFSGLLGLGGSILMVPMLLLIPSWLGFEPLDMKQVSAISIVQVFFASVAGVLVHRRQNAVSNPLVMYVGGASAVSSLVGGWLSAYVSAQFLLQLFAVVATLGAALMFIPRREVEVDGPVDEVPFHRLLALGIGLGVGMVGGLVGAPGAFIYVPLLIYVLGIPTRVTVGSTLAIVLWGSLFGMVGKVATGQVPYLPALALVLGAVPGAQLGSRLSGRLRVQLLRWVVTGVVVLATVNLWTQALG